MTAGLEAARVPLRELMDDRLLERSRDEAGGLRLTGAGSMLGELVAVVLERALQGELTAHLGYGKHDLAGHGTGSSRNGSIAKTAQTGLGPVPVQVPRDRNGTFEPVLLPKRAGRVASSFCAELCDTAASTSPFAYNFAHARITARHRRRFRQPHEAAACTSKLFRME